MTAEVRINDNDSHTPDIYLFTTTLIQSAALLLPTNCDAKLKFRVGRPLGLGTIPYTKQSALTQSV